MTNSKMNSKASILFLLALVFIGFAQNVCAQTELWIPDGPVYAIARYGNKLYAGGSFTNWAAPAGSVAKISKTTGTTSAFPKFAGPVWAIESDGANGWFIGGSFTKVADQEVPYLVHILSNGSIDTSFNPQAEISGAVYSLLRDPLTNILYVGGQFYSSELNQAKYICAFNINTGQRVAWDPLPNAAVMSLAFDGTGAGKKLYAAGMFTSITGVQRLRIARFALQESNPYLDVTWAPSIGTSDETSSYVHTITRWSSYMAVGGSFSKVSNTDISNLALLSTTSTLNNGDNLYHTGGTDLWAPNPNGTVLSLLYPSTGTRLYVGGAFTTFAGQSRSHLAAAAPDMQLIDSTFNPNVNGTVEKMITIDSGTKLCLAGNFTTVNSVLRNNLALWDLSLNSLTDWDPHAFARVITINTQPNDDSQIFAGGYFAALGGTPRPKLAEIDLTSGTLSSWAPTLSDTVYDLAIEGSYPDQGKLWVAGAFQSINGDTQKKAIAAFQLEDGADPSLLSWTLQIPPTGTLTVNDLEINYATNDNRIYLAGTINSGTPLPFLKAYTLSGGANVAWDPAISNSGYGIVNKILADRTHVYAAGLFSSAGGQSRNGLVQLSRSSALATTWNPAPNARVYSLLKHNNILYAGGLFTSISGESRQYLVAWNSDGSGNLTFNSTFNPGVNFGVGALEAINNHLFIGGGFSIVNLGAPNVERNGLAVLNTTTGVEASADLGYTFDPSPLDEVTVLYRYGSAQLETSSIYAGGKFSHIFASPYQRLALVYSPLSADPFPSVPTGGDMPGQTLVSPDTGTWTGVPPITVDETRVWKRCDAAGENCSVIEGETDSSYTIRQQDVGSTLRVSITASDALKSASMDSEYSSIIITPTPTWTPTFTPTGTPTPTVFATFTPDWPSTATPTPTATPTSTPSGSITAVATPTATPDVIAPTLKLSKITGKAGKKVSLKYKVTEASGFSRDSITVKTSKKKTIAKIKLSLLALPSNGSRTVKYNSKGKKKGNYQWCVQAVDPANNKSKSTCAKLILK